MNYREYGLDALGMNPDGYFSDQENTNYDIGFGECRGGDEPEPRLQDRRRHPARLVPRDDVRAGQATANLLKIQKKLGAYGAGGFYDAVAIDGTIARRYLSLDQAMVMGALGNVLPRTSCAGRSAPLPSRQRCGRSSGSRSSAPATWAGRPTLLA